MAGRVQFDASFTAETGAAEANVKRYADQIKQAESVLKQAERTAKQSYGEQMAQARAVGMSTAQLGKITQEYNQKLYAIGMTAKQVGQTLAEANRGAISNEDAKAQAISLTNKELQAQVLIVNELAAANSHQSHEAVSGVQATSAAIRGIEGSGGIRAIENFISKTLGLGPAMQAIFPLVGGFMFGKMLLDVGEKVVEVESKAAHAAETIKAGFDEQHAKAAVTIDDLTVQADKLQDNIDKLAGHPGNGLQTALDEARRYADKLQESLRADNKELQALFKENSVGKFGSLLSGVASTGKQEEELLADRTGLTKAVARINSDYNKQAATAGSTDALKTLGAIRDKAIRDSVQGTIDTYRRESKRLRDEQARSERNAAVEQSVGSGARGGVTQARTTNNSAKIANIEGDADKLQDFLNTQAAQQRVISLTEQEGAAKQADENKKLAKQTSHAAVEAAHKAAEEQRKGWADDLAAMQSDGKASAEVVYQFWIDQANATVRGSENYLEAGRHANESLKTVNDEHKKLVDESLKMREHFRNVGDKNTFSILGGQNSYDLKGITEQQTSLRALLDAQRQNTYQQALAQAQQDASLGTITRYDAAIQVQALHTAEYAAQLQELREALAAVDGTDNQAIARRNVLNKQIDDVTTRSTIDAMRDTASVAAQTWQGALTNANAAWVNDSRDSSRQVANLYGSVLNGINGNIVNAITGDRTSFGSMFSGIGKQVANMGLQRIESSVLGKFGFGVKADGSKGNPLHVIMDSSSVPTSLVSGSSIGGTAAGLAKAALSFLPGGGFLSGLFGGGRAIGGGVDAGTTYLVGERGPELLTMGSNAYVTPNNKLGSAMGNNVAYYTLHVGEGVTSEQMHQQLMTTLKQFHPQVVRDAVHAVNERTYRGTSYH